MCFLAGCAALAAGLHAAQALRALDLSGCVAGDAGAAALAAALPTSGLSRLHLARCDIGAEGAAALAAAVRECDSLKHLFLEGNGRVGDEGAKALAEAFTAHTAAAEGPRLAVLDVGECGITAVGAAALLAADGAASLSLFGNLAAAGAGGALLAAALAGGGQRMTHLNISGTGLVAEGAAALTAALLAGASPALRTIELGANPVRAAWGLHSFTTRVLTRTRVRCAAGAGGGMAGAAAGAARREARPGRGVARRGPGGARRTASLKHLIGNAHEQRVRYTVRACAHFVTQHVQSANAPPPKLLRCFTTQLDARCTHIRENTPRMRACPALLLRRI